MRCSTYGGELGTRTQTRRARPVGNPVNMTTMRDIQRLQYSLLFVSHTRNDCCDTNTGRGSARADNAIRQITSRSQFSPRRRKNHRSAFQSVPRQHTTTTSLHWPAARLALFFRTATGIYSSVRSVSRDRRRPGRTRGGGPGYEYHGSNVLNASTDRARPGGSHVQHRFLRAWTQGEQRNGRGMDTRSRHPPAGGRHGVSLRGLRRRTVRRPSESAYNYPLYK